MGKRLTLVLTLVLAVAMIGAALTYAGARGFRAKLTDEQRAALREKVETLKAEEASPEVIRAEVRKMLEGFGVELPEAWGQRPRRGDGPFANLTEDQRAAIREKVETLKAEGASPEGIRAEVRKMLEGFGVELPEDWGQRPRRGDGPFADLNDDQRAEIRGKMQELRSTNSTPEEFRAAVREMLTNDYGIELPDRMGLRPRGRRPGFRRLCANLTEEQRAEIREMRSSGVSPEKIRARVREMLEESGVKLPEEITSPAKLSATTAVQSAGWGQIKSQFK